MLQRYNMHCFYFEQSFVQIIQSQLECSLSEVESSDHPSKILSGLVLCRCLVEISQSRLSGNVLKRLLLTLAVSYDETKSSCPEFDIITSAINNPK